MEIQAPQEIIIFIKSTVPVVLMLTVSRPFADVGLIRFDGISLLNAEITGLLEILVKKEITTVAQRFLIRRWKDDFEHHDLIR